MKKKATAFAPATVGNVIVGFDVLGFAVENIGDHVTVELIDEPVVRIKEITGATSNIPTAAHNNTAGRALEEMRKVTHSSAGFEISIKKGIPLASGMGGSAASSVAAAVAANALLDDQFNKEQLLEFALEGETVASGGRHADNTAPCLYGGLCAIVSNQPLRVISIPVPNDIQCLLVHPHFELETKRAREILEDSVALKCHVAQTGFLAGFVAGCFMNDLELIKQSMNDLVITPQRQALIPGFSQMREKATQEGAIGFGISGAGPSVFCWGTKKQLAKIQKIVEHEFKAAGYDCDTFLTTIARQGAHVIS